MSIGRHKQNLVADVFQAQIISVNIFREKIRTTFSILSLIICRWKLEQSRPAKSGSYNKRECFWSRRDLGNVGCTLVCYTNPFLRTTSLNQLSDRIKTCFLLTVTGSFVIIFNRKIIPYSLYKGSQLEIVLWTIEPQVQIYWFL